MQRPPIMRALTMPAGDFPYGNTIGLDSPFAFFLLSLSSSILRLLSTFATRGGKKFRPCFSLPLFR